MIPNVFSTHSLSPGIYHHDLPPASAQRIAKYGPDFLTGEVDARALAMGEANVTHTQNVYSVYWNPSGLAHTEFPEVAYMHAERFAGIVSFDFAAVAYPVSSTSTVGVSFFRSGVNDIKLDYPGNIRPAELKTDFLWFVQEIQCSGSDPKSFICYVLKKLVEWRTRNANLTLARPTNRRIAEIVKIAEQHWETALPGAAKLPVLAIYSSYDCLVPELPKFR